MGLSVGVRQFNPGERLYQSMANYYLLSSSVCLAIGVVTGTLPGKKSVTYVQCPRCNIMFGLPVHGPIQYAIKDKPLPTFGIEIKKMLQVPKGADYLGKQVSLMVNMITPIFSFHYDVCREWLETNGHGDTSKWPMVLDFARVVRNAASHGGKLEFRNKNYRTITWEGLSYSPADNGKLVIGTEVFLGDMITLMLEMDDQLVAMGAPL